MKAHFKLFTLCLLLSTLGLSARAQGTAFTYQGRLNDASGPATGSYDLTFALFSVSSGAGQVGATLTNTATAVSNGLFTVTLDFGNQFPGANRWLEIAVRTNGVGTFTNLAPRQKLAATPYAIQAANATTASSATTAGSAITATTASNFSGSLAGDVTGTQSATAVSLVGGQTAANVASGASAANAATSANTASTIVKRDASGNFSVGTITAASFTGSGANVTNVNAATFGGLAPTNFWQTGGNNVAAGQFLGSTNNQAVEIKVNSQRALRLEPGTSGSPNVIGGSSGNYIQTGVLGATIAGGGTTSFYTNSVLGNYSTIGGGEGNRIDNLSHDSTIAGGTLNNIGTNVFFSAIGGGLGNTIADQSQYSTIAGGYLNTLDTNADYGTVGGGSSNRIVLNSTYGTIPGGVQNSAASYAFAAGRNAQATNTGAFVWADSTGSAFGSVSNNQFLIRAAGGVGINTNNPGTAALSVAGTVQATAVSAGTLTGNGANITNVNAALVGGLTGATFWRLDGNNVSAGQFLGSTNNQPVEIKVNGLRGFRVEPATNDTYYSNLVNIVGGSLANYIATGVRGAVISGGGAAGVLQIPYGCCFIANYGATNSVSADFAFLGGGWGNSIQPGSTSAFLGGGWNNSIQSNSANAFLGGGNGNAIQQNSGNSFLGGGEANSIQTNAYRSVLVGGNGNSIQPNAIEAVLIGGSGNSIETNANGSFLGGGSVNSIQTDAAGSFLGGGTGNNIQTNSDVSFLGGGEFNTIQPNNSYATLVGGNGNSIGTNSYASFLGGGDGNSIQPYSDHSALVGGIGNSIQQNATNSFLGGGEGNNILQNADHSFLGGGYQNTIGTNYYRYYGSMTSSVLVGGWGNTIQADLCFIGGGYYNTIESMAQSTVGGSCFIGGGQSNTIETNAFVSFIGGGKGNSIQMNSSFCFLGGGLFNQIQPNAKYSFLGGGSFNTNGGWYSAVAGGYQNYAAGYYSLAAGNRAKANYQGDYVWSDSQSADFNSTASDQYLIRAQGGVGINTNLTLEGGLTINASTFLLDHPLYLRGRDGTPDHNHGLAYNGTTVTNFSNGNVQVDGPVLWGYSGGALAVRNGGDHAVLTWTNGGVNVNGGFGYGSDRNTKTGFDSLNAQEILARVTSLPVSSWFYKTDTGARHVGPMAQDFHAAFQLGGSDDKHINIGDETGVALAAIQGLNQKLNEKDAEITELKARLEKLEQLMTENTGSAK